MTSIKKAEELMRVMNVTHDMKLGKPNSKGIPVSMHDSQIRQCALNCVDQIMREFENVMSPNPFKIYWEDVKTKINELK